MAKIDVNDIKSLREETGAGVMDVKKMLEEFDGDVEKAREELLKKSASKAAKKADRDAGDGLVYAYIHNGGKVGSLVHVACETDFVAKTEDFKKLCHELAMQVCTDDYEDVESFLKASYMRDESKTVETMLSEVVGKLGEKIELKSFVKYSVN